MNRISLEEATKRLLDKHNGNIIMFEYTKISSRAKFKCLSCDFTWEAKATGVIVVGTGCPECAKNRIHNTLRHSDEYIRNYIESLGCEWVSGEYKNTGSKLFIKFPCGHTQNKILDDLKQGTGCFLCGRKSCAEKQKFNTEDIIKYVESFGYSFIEFPNGYDNVRSKITYQCPEGHITTRSLTVFKRKNSCGKCENIKKSIARAKPTKDVMNNILSKSCEWVNGEYINQRSSLLIKFSCGHEQWIPYYLFKMRNFYECFECTREKANIATRRDPEEIIKFVKNTEFEFCNFIGEYHNQNTKINYFCKTCNSINVRKVCDFFKNPTCPKCVKEKNRLLKIGENNTAWKGGNQRISKYFRRYISDWYLDSLKSNNYKCIISGDAAKTIHHLYPFYKIVDKFMKSKGHSRLNVAGDFTSDYLLKMINEFIIFHNSFGLGVPLTKKIHKFFHKNYTTMNNTPEQFYEFQQRIASGELILPD